MLVVAVAVVVRLLTWTELRDSALLHLEHWPASEMHYVDRWARAVADGDLLLRSRIEPADAGFLCTTPPAGEPPAARCADPASAAALQRWARTSAYWQAPLYPYFVAAVYTVAGPSPPAVLALQAVFGVISCWLAFAIAARLFGDTAAVAAGLAAALLGTGVYYETMLVSGACTGLAALATLYALLRAAQSERPFASAFLAGIAGAAASLLSATALFAVAVTSAAALVVRVLDARRRRWQAAAALLAGLACGAALMWTPLVARNLAVGAPMLSIAARTPIDFVMGNALGATATARVKPNASTTAIFAQRDGETSTGVAASDVSGNSGAAAPTGVETAGAPAGVAALIAATIATHPSGADWLRLVAAKFAGFWRWYEIAGDANYYYFLEHLPVLSRFLIAWPLIAGVAALGLVSAVVKGLPVALPLVWIVATAAGCALLFNLSMLRFPAALVATVLVGQGIATLVELDKQRRYALGLAAVAVIVATGYATLARWQVPFGPIRPQYYDVTNDLAVAVAEEQQAAGRTDRALATVRKQRRAEPRALRTALPGGELALDPWIAANARSFEAVYRSQARYAAMLGDDAGARQASLHAERLGAVVDQWKSWPGR
ncbi:MAG: glycosyltransferase family 39 protein [Deltaproteobacteria bacterium]|nr:glycosyltransferase family 39 protein [Deltaproteobacteria bacterium]